MIRITENIVKYEDIGDVKYVYNRKARNFTIRINQKGEVRVTVPRYGSMKRAESFLMGKRSWVKKKLEQINTQNNGILELREGMVLDIRDKQFVLKGGKNSDGLELAFWKLLRSEANRILPERVDYLSRQKDLPFKELKIKKMKSRWGSCTSKNNINLNSWLVLLPDYLIDYVILHELVHTVHKNHSPEFWNYLDRLVDGKSLLYRRELRANRIMYRVKTD